MYKRILITLNTTAEENDKLMVERWPHLVDERDQRGKTPLEVASEEGTSSLVESMQQKDPLRS